MKYLICSAIFAIVFTSVVLGNSGNSNLDEITKSTNESLDNINRNLDKINSDLQKASTDLQESNDDLIEISIMLNEMNDTADRTLAVIIIIIVVIFLRFIYWLINEFK